MKSYIKTLKIGFLVSNTLLLSLTPVTSVLAQSSLPIPSQATSPSSVPLSATGASTDQTSAGGTNTGMSQSGTNTGGSSSGTNTGKSVSGTNVTPATFTLSNPLGSNITVSGIILNFMQIASYLAVLFGVIMLVWVGLQFILARGNSERMKELSKWLLYIVIGVAVILGARILISVIINTLQATGTVNPTVINNAQNALNSQ